MMRNSYFTILLCLIFNALALGQAEFKSELSDEEIEALKQEIEQDYQYYLEGLLNLIDPDLSLESKYISRSLVLSLFQQSSSTIQDYLENPLPERKNAIEYTSELIRLSEELPLFKKRYKFADSINVYPTAPGINLDSANDPIDFDRIFQAYKAEVYVLEEIHSSRLLPSSTNVPLINVYEKGIVKKLNFRIAHNAFDEYELGITSIDIVDKNNRNIDYATVRNQIRNSNYAWSDKAEEKYIAELRSHLQLTEVVVDPPEVIIPPSTTEYKLPQLRAWDYLIPGNGYENFVTRDKASKISKRYKAAFGASLLASAYFRVREWDFRNKHNAGLTDPDHAFDWRADQQQLYSNISLATGGATLLIHILDLSGRMKGQKKIFRTIGLKDNTNENNKISFNIAPSSVELTYSLN